MEITAPMLRVAIQKATEAGLFPRRCTPYDMAINQQIMLSILIAVLETASTEKTEQGAMKMQDVAEVEPVTANMREVAHRPRANKRPDSE
jgi:hypothetical protein